MYLESTKYIPASETGALAAFEPLSAYAVSILFMGNRVGFVEMAGAVHHGHGMDAFQKGLIR